MGIALRVSLGVGGKDIGTGFLSGGGSLGEAFDRTDVFSELVMILGSSGTGAGRVVAGFAVENKLF